MKNNWSVVLLGLSLVTLAATPAEARARTEDQFFVVSAKSPIYPPLARAACIRGLANLEVSIDSEGKVLSTRIISGHPLFRITVESTVKQWLFSPFGEENFVRNHNIQFVFQIVPWDTPAKELNPVFSLPEKVEVRTYPPHETCLGCEVPLQKGECKF